jgi:hypothetical protein
LDVPDWIKAETGRYPMLDEVDEGGGNLLGIVALHEMEVRVLSRRSEVWQLPSANTVC